VKYIEPFISYCSQKAINSIIRSHLRRILSNKICGFSYQSKSCLIFVRSAALSEWKGVLMRTMLLNYLEQGAIFNFEQGMKEKKITELVLICNQRNKWNHFAAGDFGLTVKKLTSFQIVFLKKKSIKRGARLQNVLFLYWFRLFIVQAYSMEKV
jgi:hypothetical protein